MLRKDSYDTLTKHSFLKIFFTHLSPLNFHESYPNCFSLVLSYTHSPFPSLILLVLQALPAENSLTSFSSIPQLFQLFLSWSTLHSPGRQEMKDPSHKGAREAGRRKIVNIQTSIFLSLSNILSINIYLLSCQAQTTRFGPYPETTGFSH